MTRLTQRCTDNLLISVTVCFIAGASIAFVFSANLAAQPPAPLVLPLLLVLVGTAPLLQARLKPLTTLPFFFLIGLLHTHWALQPMTDPTHIGVIISEKTKVTLVGRILTMVEYDGEKSRFELAAESLLIHDGSGDSAFQPVHGRMQLTLQGTPDPAYIPGAEIMALATVDRIRDYQTPGAFKYRLQMATKSIFSSGWIQSPQEILLVRSTTPALLPQLRSLPEQIRQHTGRMLDQHLDPEIAGFYKALLIGSLVSITPPLIEAFKENGCFHVLSISGLHLSLLGLFMVAAITFLLKRSQWLLLHTHVPTLALALTAPVLCLYTFIAGFNIPAIRSLAMALLVLFAVMVRRQRSLVHLIAAAALLLLALNPLALFTASFQLSFAAVLAITLIYPRLPLFINEPDSNTTRSQALCKGGRIVQSMLLVSLAATLGTMPIMLYHFNRFSLIGPLMNLLIEPLLCLWALPFGLLAIPLLWIAPDLAILLLHCGGLGIRLTIWLAEQFAGMPFASLWTITPNLLEINLYYSILLLLLTPNHTGRRLALAAGLTGILLGSFTWSLWRPNSTSEMTVSFLDVGQGAATLINLPNGANVLIDGGGALTERFDPGRNLIAPFLWRNRIWRLDDMIVTHPHQDHYNGLPFVAERFHPRRLIINGDQGDEPAYDQFLEKIRGQGIPIAVAVAGDVLQQSEDLRLTCLGMNDIIDHSPSWSTNDRSLVLRLLYKERSFLLPGDITLLSENKLMQGNDHLGCDVLLAPHHGSRTSSGQDFIAQVSPVLVAVSAGRTRQGTLPAPEHLRNWRQNKILALVTAQEGTITCRTDGRNLRASTFTGERYILEEKGGRPFPAGRGLMLGE